MKMTLKVATRESVVFALYKIHHTMKYARLVIFLGVRLDYLIEKVSQK